MRGESKRDTDGRHLKRDGDTYRLDVDWNGADL